MYPLWLGGRALLHLAPIKALLFLQVTSGGNHLAAEEGRQLHSDKWQACGRTAGPADDLTDRLLWTALCCVCCVSGPLPSSLHCQGCMYSAKLCCARPHTPSVHSTAHLVMSRCSLSSSWCYRRGHPVCDVTTGSFWPLPEDILKAVPIGAVEPLSKRERSWLHANLCGTRMHMGKAAMRDTVVLTGLVKHCSFPQKDPHGHIWALAVRSSTRASHTVVLLHTV